MSLNLSELIPQEYIAIANEFNNSITTWDIAYVYAKITLLALALICISTVIYIKIAQLPFSIHTIAQQYKEQKLLFFFMIASVIGAIQCEDIFYQNLLWDKAITLCRKHGTSPKNMFVILTVAGGKDFVATMVKTNKTEQDFIEYCKKHLTSI